jgi:hypothetical protein
MRAICDFKGVPLVLGVAYPTERRPTMRHPEVLFTMVKEHQESLRHEADMARAAKGIKRPSSSRTIVGNLRVFLTSFL